MIPDPPQIAWSQAIPNRLDDRARDALSAALGLTFYGVDKPATHTIAHRFVEAGQDTLLRVVQDERGDQSIELVTFGEEPASQRAHELELAAMDALAKLTPRRGEASRVQHSPLEPLGEWVAELAERLSGAEVLLPGRLQPIEVLGEETDLEAGPLELLLPEGAELLAKNLRQRATFDGSTLLVWLSGTWMVSRPSSLVLYAATSEGDVLSAQAELHPERARLRLAMAWPYGSPPTEVLLAVMPGD